VAGYSSCLTPPANAADCAYDANDATPHIWLTTPSMLLGRLSRA
jgi:hypothetical protein